MTFFLPPSSILSHSSPSLSTRTNLSPPPPSPPLQSSAQHSVGKEVEEGGANATAAAAALVGPFICTPLPPSTTHLQSLSILIYSCNIITPSQYALALLFISNASQYSPIRGDADHHHHHHHHHHHQQQL